MICAKNKETRYFVKVINLNFSGGEYCFPFYFLSVEKLNAAIRILDLSKFQYSRTMTTLSATSVLAKIVEQMRNALLVEKTNNLFITAKITGECFEIGFSTGESAVLSM